MQELPGAPGTARQGRTGTNVPATRGGVATQPRAPGHGRPPAAPRAAGHDPPCATHKAPGHDEPLASTAGAPGYDRLSAVAIATAPLPAGVNRPRQGVLPRVPANPRILIYLCSHRDTTHTRTLYRRTTRYAQSRESRNPPPLHLVERGRG